MATLTLPTSTTLPTSPILTYSAEFIRDIGARITAVLVNLLRILGEKKKKKKKFLKKISSKKNLTPI